MKGVFIILKNDCFDIKIESIEGFGADVFVNILGKYGALYLGLNATSFWYVKDDIVKGSVRYAKENVPIRANNHIQIPDVLVIFDMDLYLKSQDLMVGVSENTSVVINTNKEPKEVRKILKMYGGKLYCIDGFKIADKLKSYLNIVLLGATLKALDFGDYEKMEQCVKDVTKIIYKENMEQNLKALKEGYENVVYKNIKPDNKYEYIVGKV